ncbi:hypothetical protein [Nocardioides sp.]|uniref:hypothetical protein n=1 Tax=Nocardioides sp. TaxID=35761 RepID=UPI003516C22A
MRILETTAPSAAPSPRGTAALDAVSTGATGPSTATCLVIVVLVLASVLAAAAAPGLLQMWAAGHLRHEPVPAPPALPARAAAPDLVQQLVTVATALDLGDVARARRDLAATLDVLLEEPSARAS